MKQSLETPTLVISSDPDLVTQKYLETYREFDCEIDPNTKAANVFAGAIAYASVVFANHLILGGNYQHNKEDKMKILEHLNAIQKILSEY